MRLGQGHALLRGWTAYARHDTRMILHAHLIVSYKTCRIRRVLYDVLFPKKEEARSRMSLSAPSPRSTRAVHAGGLCWLLSAVFFVAQALAQTVFSPSYSLLDDRVS